MEFKDRIVTNPGRVSLKNVSTGVTTTYDVTLADGTVTQVGTPLNKSTFDQMTNDIVNSVSSNPNIKGPKGDKGDKGDTGSPYSRTFLVGTNTSGQEGWYKLGSFTVTQHFDYHARLLVTSTFNDTLTPGGVIDIDVRMGTNTWDAINIRWIEFKGVNPEYIKYYASTTGVVTLYAYVPIQWAFYRVDILGESNRDGFSNLFVPVTSYGNVYATRYATSVSGTALSAISKIDSSITVNYFSGTSTYNGKTYSSSKTAQWWYTTIGGRVFNYIKLGLEISGDCWLRIPLGRPVNISCLPYRNTTSGYTPGFICWSDDNYTYIGLDENNMQGAFITIVQ